MIIGGSNKLFRSELQTQNKNIRVANADEWGEALKQVPLQKVIEFTKLKNLNESSKVQALINHIKDVDNFKTVFKVVE